jgi:hypothetical protein
MDSKTAKLKVVESIATPSSFTVGSVDFDDWARAVRQQMLDCLQKRAGRSHIQALRDRR